MELKFEKLNFKKYTLSLLAFLIIGGAALSADPLNTKLTEIEKTYYGNTYENENTNSRLYRLEKAIYGVTYNKPPKVRIEKIYKDLNMGTESPQPPVNNTSSPSPTKNIGPKAEAGIKYPIVDKLEQKIFKKSSPNEDIYVRLSRLEKQIFKKESTASLNERVSALSDKILGGDRIAASDSDIIPTDEIIFDNGHNGTTTGAAAPADDTQYNYYSYEKSKNRIQEASRESYEQNYDLDILEKNLFGKKFVGEASDKRLTRLESQVFQRTFKDTEEARTQRLLAVTTAQKTSKEYDSNKWGNRINTGIQIGSILLMVLAMIL